ncbi:hypothetical protein A0U92_08350 [Acetobacter aceti]|uniref:Uncharacterized protein n=1 Tax=Acetobacter aceti TaxID=435 RepID=A0A1U9KG67_ACEAC|nr:hypothetical protein A0U92_08350 [Acetobacter aceti]
MYKLVNRTLKIHAVFFSLQLKKHLVCIYFRKMASDDYPQALFSGCDFNSVARSYAIDEALLH